MGTKCIYTNLLDKHRHETNVETCLTPNMNVYIEIENQHF